MWPVKLSFFSSVFGKTEDYHRGRKTITVQHNRGISEFKLKMGEIKFDKNEENF